MVVKDFIDFIYKKNSLLKRSQINWNYQGPTIAYMGCD